jgi:hypothetical protein
LAPGSSLSEDKSCCGSLGVILGDHRGGDTCQGASLSSECRHDDSARKLQVANLYLVAPACLLMIHRIIIKISTKIKKYIKYIYKNPNITLNSTFIHKLKSFDFFHETFYLLTTYRRVKFERKIRQSF